MPLGISFKPIVPDKLPLFDTKEAKREYARALNETIEEANRDFKKTIRTWRTKPGFLIRRASPVKLKAQVFTTNEIYFYVTRGTRPHIIRPKNAAALSFRSGFQPKTTPRMIRSDAGRRFGPRVFARQVHHPGTKARDFDVVIAKRLRTKLTDEMRLANRRLAQRSRR